MQPLNIHPDFSKIQAFELPFKRPFLLQVMNSALGFAGALKCNKLKTIIDKTKIIGLDGYRIPVLIIQPEGLPARSSALVYCHGGGFVLKHSPQHVENAVRYAREANCRVIFIDYR